MFTHPESGLEYADTGRVNTSTSPGPHPSVPVTAMLCSDTGWPRATDAWMSQPMPRSETGSALKPSRDTASVMRSSSPLAVASADGSFFPPRSPATRARSVSVSFRVVMRMPR